MAKQTHQPIPSTPNQADHLGLERLIFFSDAVFAIAITLLALQIRLPLSQGEVTNAALLKSLLAIWPDYLAYTLSFLVIGVFWIGHHRKFRYIQRYDGNLLFLNLLLLMAIAFTPFPSSVLSEYGNRTATIFYALVMTVTGLLSASIWWYAAYHNRLIDPQMDVRRRHRETWPPLIVPAVFLLSIGLAFINDDLAKYSWGLIILVAVPSLILR